MLRAVGLGLALGAMLGGTATAQAPSQYDGHYVGELTLAKTIRGDCTPPPLGALFPLTISRGEVRFAYVPRFNTTLSGRVDPSGAFLATGRARKGVVRMTGHVDGSDLIASIVSPSCIYVFRTKS